MALGCETSILRKVGSPAILTNSSNTLSLFSTTCFCSASAREYSSVSHRATLTSPVSNVPVPISLDRLVFGFTLRNAFLPNTSKAVLIALSNSLRMTAASTSVMSICCLISSFSHALAGNLNPSGPVRCMAKKRRINSLSFMRTWGLSDPVISSRVGCSASSASRSVYDPWYMQLRSSCSFSCIAPMLSLSKTSNTKSGSQFLEMVCTLSA
mmetsp:Transcript_5574/g.34575  ORF Transcript_5574/g.34575 Transcript_5574/m.34575 type:complete len:211 (+) Transcript_5574:2219-2851(+)